MSDAGDDGGYNDGNRAFLQAIMARGTMTLKEGKEVLAEIFSVDQGRIVKPEDVSNDDFSVYISTAQDAIAPFDYEITTTQHQLTKTRSWAIINSNSDPATQFATIHTPDEIGFIQRILHAMFETYNTKRREVMAVSSMQALKKEIIKPGQQEVAEGTQATEKGLTQQEAEKCLGVLVSEGWFELSRESYYTLTPRALMELRSWLVSTFNDPEDEEDGQRIKDCEACKEVVTTGQRCANFECPVRLHDICQQAYWNSRKNDACPKCKTPWVQDKHFVGQRVITKTEEYLRAKRKSGGGGGGRNRRVHREEVEEEEVEEGRSPPASSPGMAEDEEASEVIDEDE